MLKSLANVWEIKIEEKINVQYKIKADYAKLGPKFGKDSAIIIMRITEQSPESIMKKLDKSGKFQVKLDSGKKVDIVADDLIIDKKLPEGLAGISGQGYDLYLDVTETPEMLLSGFSREVIRKIQALRKKAGLNKPDKISLVVATDMKLEIDKEKVGAKDLEFASEKEAISKKWSDKFKIRKKEHRIRENHTVCIFVANFNIAFFSCIKCIGSK